MSASGTTRTAAEPQEVLFFDGECGLCHRWVLFTLARERGRALFRFAPLQGPTFEQATTAEERAALPDSMAVRARDGRLLVRSEAALHVMRRIGGFWGGLARVLGIVPRLLLDLGYRVVARLRRLLFRKPDTACPLVPPGLADRFDP
jgi:predicted DCC family thiol-disulfide oxidoreductase YuxK